MRGGLPAVLISLGLVACGGGYPTTALPDDACRPAEDDEARPWESRGYAMSVPWFAPERGADRPRVVVQVFSDFECPYCARASPTLERVVEEYGACVQVVWRHYPMPYHADAALAARAAHEVYRQAGDEAFWRYHDLLFADQAHLEREDLERHAATLEIDMEAFGAALDGDGHEEILERDRATIADLPGELEIGTPSFFVNGTLIHGARSFEHFRWRIEQALADSYETQEDR